MEPVRRTDPRITRTRNALVDALLALVEEQDFVTITISDIARRAGVNRKTFYLHYRDKDDVLAEAFDALFDELTSISRRFVAAQGPLRPEMPPSSTVALFTRLAEHRALYRRLIGVNGSTRFAARLRAFYREQFLLLWDELERTATVESPPPDFRAHFAAAATEGIATWWLKEPRDQTPETVAAWLWQVIRPMWFEIGIRDDAASSIGRSKVDSSEPQ